MDAVDGLEVRLEQADARHRPGGAVVGGVAVGDVVADRERAQHEDRDAGRDVAQRVAQRQSDRQSDCAERRQQARRVDAERVEGRDCAEEVDHPGNGAPREAFHRLVGAGARDAAHDVTGERPGRLPHKPGHDEDQ